MDDLLLYETPGEVYDIDLDDWDEAFSVSLTDSETPPINVDSED